jgi:hypothetical protein
MHVSLDSALGRQRRLNSVGESVLQIAPSAAAAYSLRSLTGGDPKVVRVRRSALSGADNEIDFTVSEVSSGALTSFVTEPVSTLLNSAYYFSPDSHSHVDFDSDITLADGETMSLKYFFDGVTGTDLLFDSGGASTNSMLITTSISPRVRINSESIDFGVGCKLLINQLDTLTMARSGNDITITTGTGAVTKSFTSGAFTFNRLGGNSSQTFQGVFYNLQIGSRHNYTGLGGAATAWNDTVGSNNGTPDNLVSFTGQTVHGFVDTWFDQSGNSKDAVQPTADNQPKIVNAGALVVDSGIAGLDFDGSTSSRFLVAHSVSDLEGSLSMFSTSVRDATGYTVSLSNSSSGVKYFGIQEGGSSSVANPRNTTDVLVSDSVSGVDRLTFALTTGATSTSVGTNGSAVTTSTSDYGDDFDEGDLNQIAIGLLKTVSASGHFNGRIREILVYTSDQTDNRTALETNIAAEYGITLS